MTRHLADIGPEYSAEKWFRDHHKKIEKLHVDTQKNSLIPKILFFSIYDEK